MTPTNRNRTLWLLVALVSIHTLVTTAIFLSTGTLPNALMVFTLVVFAICTIAAIYFIAHAPRKHLRRAVLRDGHIERVEIGDATAGAPEPVVRVQIDEPASAKQ